MKERLETKWYALYTKSRSEKKTANELFKKGIEVYQPLIKSLRQWSDRKRIVELPLLHSYLFVKINLRSYFDILNTKGVVKFIGFNGKPVPIPDWQINNLKILLNSEEDFEVISEELLVGDSVYVERGPLKGLKGILIEHRAKQKVLIRLDTIKQSILINIHSVLLKKQHDNRAI